MGDCIFCKISKGEADKERPRTYEDDLILAFPDKHPVSKGHTLIIPREHYESIFEIPEQILARIIIAAKSLAEQLRVAHGATGVNVMHASGKDAQQSVFHLHFHVVPRYSGDNLDLWFHSRER